MTIRFDSLHAADMDKQISRYLTERGWFVQPPHSDRERPSQLARRLGVSLKHVSESLHDPCCPPFFRARVGPTGRLCEIVSNAKLEAWLLLHKPAGK